MMNYYQPGTRPMSDVPGGNDVRWDNSLVMLEEPQIGAPPVLVRLAGGMLALAYHYLRWRSPKDGEIKNLFVLCPNFSVKEQMDVAGGCPVCLNFNDSNLPDHIRIRQSFRYYIHAFHVSKVLNGASDGTFGLIKCNYFDKKELTGASQMYGHPVDHPQQGCALRWARQPSDNPKRKADTKFYDDKPLPLTYHGDGRWEMSVGGRIARGVEQPLLKIIPEPNAAELEKKLRDFGLYDNLARHRQTSGGGQPTGGGWGQPPQQPQQQPQQPAFQPPTEGAQGTQWDAASGAPQQNAADPWGATQPPQANPPAAAPPQGGQPAADPWGAAQPAPPQQPAAQPQQGGQPDPWGTAQPPAAQQNSAPPPTTQGADPWGAAQPPQQASQPPAQPPQADPWGSAPPSAPGAQPPAQAPQQAPPADDAWTDDWNPDQQQQAGPPAGQAAAPPAGAPVDDSWNPPNAGGDGFGGSPSFGGGGF